MHAKSLQFAEHVTTPWTVAHQSPMAMGFSRQEYWSGLPWPSPGYLPDPGIKPEFPMFLALAGRSLPVVPPGNPPPSKHKVHAC